MKYFIFFAVFFFGIEFLNAQSTHSISLMPQPRKLEVGTGRFPLTADFSIALSADKIDTVLFKAANRMLQTLNRRTILFIKPQKITGPVNNPSAALQIEVSERKPVAQGVNESYSIEITDKRIQLRARTTIGALCGMETLLQLVSWDAEGYYFPLVQITDEPRFPWRGLMIDVSRHFIPFEQIKRHLDAMAAVKLNVFHFHISDDEGFRIESKIFPDLQRKGSDGDFYTQTQIRELVSYAADRGILVVPEFDMPGHTTSWFAGYPALASAPGPYEPGPRFKIAPRPDGKAPGLMDIMQMINNYPTPAFDPSSHAAYDFLDKFFGEMATLFPSPWFHIGADEVNGVAWKQNPKIVAFMTEKGLKDTHALQAYFVKRVQQILAKHKKKTIGWEELLSDDLPKEVTVQVWNNGSVKDKAYAQGHPILISRGFYLDLFMPAYIHRYNSLIPDSAGYGIAPGFLGGEGALWTEIADQHNAEIRAWPRAAAIAEMLWSPVGNKDVEDFYRRLFVTGKQLDEAGLALYSIYERGLRRLAGNNDITNLKILADVVTPIKGYKKVSAKMTANPASLAQTSPVNGVSDILFCDSEVKRAFRKNVSLFLSNKDSATANLIRAQLYEWKKQSDLLKQKSILPAARTTVDSLSFHLARAAETGLLALEKMQGSTPASPEWIKEKMLLLALSGKQFGEAEIAVIPEIAALVKGQLQPEPQEYPVF